VGVVLTRHMLSGESASNCRARTHSDIVAIGDGVTNIEIGDHVAVYFYVVYGHCR
jgi:hypothetical protein